MKLRPLRESDLENMMRWVNDPDVVGRFAHFQREVTEAEELQYIRSMIESEEDDIYVVEADDGHNSWQQRVLGTRIRAKSYSSPG